MSDRFWIPVPAIAYRVLAAIKSEQRLDLLSETILRLLRLGTRSINELSELLGMREDIIASSVAGLIDERLAVPVAGSKDLYVAVPSDADDFTGRVLQSGWVFYCAHLDRLLPRIWLGNELPSRASNECMNDQVPQADSLLTIEATERPRVKRPKSSEMDDRLRELAMNTSLRIRPLKRERLSLHADTKGGGIPSLPDFDPMEDIEPEVRCVLRDTACSELRPEHRFITVYSMVELLPRIVGEPIAVYRLPDLFAGNELHRNGFSMDQPVDDRLEAWIESNCRPLMEKINERRSRECRKQSVVLANSTIKDIADLNDRCNAHRLGLERRLEAKWDDIPLSCQEYIADAQQKYLIWMASDPGSSSRDVCYAYEHALEAFGVYLRNLVLPSIELWREEWNSWNDVTKKEFETKVLSRRFEELRLRDLLSTSFNSFYSNAGTAKAIARTFKDIASNRLGAGESVAIWLLPLAFSSDENAKAYANKLGRLLKRMPNAIRALDDLIKFRTVVAHHRESESDPMTLDLKTVDEKLFHVTSAVGHVFSQESFRPR